MIDSLSWPALIDALVHGENLSVSEASWAMDSIMSGEATAAQMAGFLVALDLKGETVDEIIGFRDAILEHSTPLDLDPMALDIVGTGGDRFQTVNVSTMACVVCAATGIPVIKHGNRAVSSRSGASDVLAALGIDLSADAEHVAEVQRRTGITFAWASAFHRGFGNVAPVRAELGIPTVFNFLGPLVNPARPEASAVGVSSLERVPLIAGVFQARGATALVFRGDDGLDELSTTGHSHIWEISRGRVTEHDLNPVELGLPRATIEQLRGGDPEHNAQLVRQTLSGATGPVRDIVLLNAAGGIVAFRLAQDTSERERPLLDRFQEGIDQAREAIDSGAAAAKLEEWIAAWQSLGKNA